MSNKTEIAKILQKLEIAYPGYKTDKSEEVLEVWFDELAGYSVETLNDAVGFMISNNKYFPSLHEVLACCRLAEKPVKADGQYSRLLARRKELEDNLYNGEFRSSDWIQLSDDFEAIDKPHAALRCRERAGTIVV